MPSRPVTALIVLAWMGTFGWFAHRELWPILFPGDSPPFVIELADEVSSEFAGEAKRPDVLWAIYRNDKRIGRAETRLRYYRQDNTFELETRIVKMTLWERVPILGGLLPRRDGEPDIYVSDLITKYRLDRRGELHSMSMRGAMVVIGQQGKASFTGEVRDGMLYRAGQVDIFGTKSDVKLEPIEAPTGSVLNPMQPVPRIKGLKPGRRWRMPLVNPLGDVIEPALEAVMEKKVNLKLPSGPKFLDAEVLNETTEITINGEKFPCRIIEYRGEGQPARTYVRISDGAVLRQEAYLNGEKIVMERE